MELMGLKVQTRVPTGVDAKSNSKASPSNDSSGLFQKKLDQFSPSPEKAQVSEPPVANTSWRKSSPQLPNSKNLPPQLKQEDTTNVADPAPERSVEDTIAKPQQLESGPVDSLTRRSAIQVFMKKMEQEVGVDSSELVQAMNQLSAAELAAPPEANVDKIIGFLDLTPAQQEKAAALFNEMLAHSEAASMAEYLQATDRQLSLAVMSRNQARQENVNQSIAKMNEQFFTQPQGKVTPQEALAKSQPRTDEAQRGNSVISPAFMAQAPSQASSAGMAPSAAPAPVVASMQAMNSPAGFNAPPAPAASFFPQGVEMSQAGMSTAPMAPVAPAMVDGMPLTMPTEWAGISKASMGRSAYGVSSNKAQNSADGLGLTDGLVDLSSAELAQLDPAAMNPEFDNNSQQFSSQQQMFKEIAEKAESGEFFDVESAQMTVKADPSMASQPQEKSALKAESFMVAHQPTDGEQAANVKEIISQAQFLVKNGGGEMKIALNPEGMGQLNMKVAVQDGQVSIEMITESDEVKKLLEKGLGDLKATLASHKLNVDNVKVDFSGEIAKAFDHAHDEAQRQSAQNFMEQFRQENGAWRRNMFDFQAGDMGRYPGGNGPQDELLRVQASKPKAQQRRLDLVA